jgi:hypothetical protein
VTSSRSDVLPAKIRALGYSQSFIENVNIMFLIIVIEFFVAILLTFLAKKIKCLRTFASVLLHQIFVTLLIFNCFNIAFSFGLHMKYATAENTASYTFSTAAAVISILFCFVALICLEALKK